MEFSFAESSPGTEAIKLEGKFNTKISLNLPKFRKMFYGYSFLRRICKYYVLCYELMIKLE